MDLDLDANAHAGQGRARRRAQANDGAGAEHESTIPRFLDVTIPLAYMHHISRITYQQLNVEARRPQTVSSPEPRRGRSTARSTSNAVEGEGEGQWAMGAQSYELS